MVCDEVPGVLEHIDLAIAKTHEHVTAHIDASAEVGQGLCVLQPANRAALEVIHANPTGDQNIASFERLTATVLSADHQVFAIADSYRDLIENPETRGKLDVFAVLQPEFVAGYKSMTFMGANITATELFVVWSKLFNVAWMRHPEMGDKLRYEQHQNGDRLTISYLFENRTSKNFLGGEDAEGATVLDRVTDVVRRYWDEVPFLWQANSDAMPKGFDFDNRLPGVSHGLDKAEWKRVHNVALLAAMNRKTAAYGFLTRLGVTQSEAHATVSWQNDYQAMMRCSLRDPNAIAPVQVIVGTRDGAEWIGARFPGCTVRKLEHFIDEPRAAGRPAREGERPKTSTERSRERRARLKVEANRLS